MSVDTVLYKYRAVTNQTFDALIADKIFFADPRSFNDPLEASPSLKVDISTKELKAAFISLAEKRVRDEMTSAAKIVKYRGPKTTEHIARHAKRTAIELVENIEYNATNPAYEISDPLTTLLAEGIEDELLQRYNKGIVSLAERDTCPLMWSHYGDQHKGICIGYSIPADMTDNTHKAVYGGGRQIKASDVVAMLSGNTSAQRKVDKAVLLTKATDWQYEREWRVIGERGLQNSRLEMREIVFGIRCPVAAKYMLVKTLSDRQRPVRFYEIRQQSANFHLKKFALDCDEMLHHFPVCHRALIDLFARVELPFVEP